jgi:hypothetical protein
MSNVKRAANKGFGKISLPGKDGISKDSEKEIDLVYYIT